MPRLCVLSVVCMVLFCVPSKTVSGCVGFAAVSHWTRERLGLPFTIFLFHMLLNSRFVLVDLVTADVWTRESLALYFAMLAFHIRCEIPFGMVNLITAGDYTSKALVCSGTMFSAVHGKVSPFTVLC
jgi:hypothetical protein